MRDRRKTRIPKRKTGQVGARTQSRARVQSEKWDVDKGQRPKVRAEAEAEARVQANLDNKV